MSSTSATVRGVRGDRSGGGGAGCIGQGVGLTLSPLSRPTVAPQTAQAGVAVLAVTVSVGLLLLVVAAFYCMRRKGRPGCCRRSEKGAP